MVMNLPSVIPRLVDASSAKDLDAFVTCFAAEAVVEDEGRTHRGVALQQRWPATFPAARQTSSTSFVRT